VRFLTSQANDAKGFRLERTLTGHSGQVWATVSSPDGVRAVSGGDDLTIRIWDLGAGHLERTIDGHVEVLNKVSAVALTPYGTRIVSAGHSRKVLVWSLATGILEQVLEGNIEYVNALAVTPDGASSRPVTTKRSGSGIWRAAAAAACWSVMSAP
jgi:WD40 repeat protein